MARNRNQSVCSVTLHQPAEHQKCESCGHTDKGSQDRVSSWFKKECNDMCSRSFLQKKLPICEWLPSYSIDTLVHDALAGLTVGLTAIPQGIAYAVVAGLEPQYGLYAGFMGAFVYIFFGSCKDVTIGPTAIMALMTQNFVTEHGPDYAVLLCFLTGSIIFLLGVLRMGFLVDFISMPVTVGFTSAAAITIGSSQIKNLFGIGGKSSTFLDAWVNTFSNIEDTRLWDSVLGFCTIVVLVATKMLKDYTTKRDVSQLSLTQKILNKTLWLISLARNAVVVVVGTALAYIFSQNGETPFRLTGKIGDGLPPFGPPPFSTVINGTTDSFSTMVSEIGTSLGLVPLIAILESIAIAKAFAKGKAIDATQELIALGLCNIAGSFVRSMPVTGSFTRTAVNNASGVKTPLGGLFTGALVLLALGLLTSTFFYIPKASLAGLIICAMFYMVEYEIVPLLWRTKKLDLIPLATTFVCCLFISLDYGILIGIGVNLLFILYESARPTVHIQRLSIDSQKLLLVQPEHGLAYPSAEHLRELVMETCCADSDSLAIVVIDGSHISSIDATVAKNIKLLSQDLILRQQQLILWNWKHTALKTCEGLDQNLQKLFRYSSNLQQILQGELKLDNGPENGDQTFIFTVPTDAD